MARNNIFNDARDSVEALITEIEELQQENGKLTDQVEELESKLEKAEEQVSELKDQITELQNGTN